MTNREELRRALLKDILKREAQEATKQPAVEASGADLGIPSTSPEVAELAQPPVVTKEDVKNFGVGAGQGATMGFADEGIGAVRGAGAKLMGADESLSDLYAKYRDIERQRYEAAKTESPTATGAGELTGGLASAALTPALGTGKLVAGLAGRAKSVPALGKFLSGGSESLLGKYAGKGAAMAAEGAGIGAVAGTGFSNQALGSPELTQDIGSGALAGSLITPALGLAGSAITGIKKDLPGFIKERPQLQHLDEAYELGKKQMDLGTESTRSKLFQQYDQEAPKDLVNRVYETKSYLGGLVEKSLNDAHQAGQKINISQDLVDAAQQWEQQFSRNPAIDVDPNARKLIQNIMLRPDHQATPLEMKSIKDTMQGFIDKLRGDNSAISNATRGMATAFKESVDTKLKTAVPEYAKSAQKYSEFLTLVPETILRKGVPGEFAQTSLSDLKNPKQKLFEGTHGMLEGGSKAGAASRQDLVTLMDLEKNLMALEKSQPEAIQKMGFNSAKDAINKIKKDSTMLALVQEAYGQHPQQGFESFIWKVMSVGQSSTGQGTGVLYANKLGQLMGSKSVGVLGIPFKGTGKIFNAGEQKLRDLASRLSNTQNPVGQHAGQALIKALDNKSDVARNAALFSILQNPDLRGMIQEDDIDEVSQ